MGQTNLIRTEFSPVELITSSSDSAEQLLDFTSYFRMGDIVDIVAKNAKGCYEGSPLATGLTVCGIIQNHSLIFDTQVDTTTPLPVGGIGWYAVAKNIDDGQEAIDRLYRYYTNIDSPGNLQICQGIVDSVSSSPSPGQTTLYVNDVDLFRAGDDIIISVSGIGIVADGMILSLDPEGDEIHNMSKIVIDADVDLTGTFNQQICSTGLSVVDGIDRLKENIDKIDQPIENEYMGVGNCDDISFEAANLFLMHTSKLLLDGRRLRLGTMGTRAELVQDASNAELTFTSMHLGTTGNLLKVELVAGAGLTVTVTGTFEDSNQKVSITNNSGAATAAQIAAAVNADADARKLVQVQFGGTGAGVTAPFAATSLAGGLDDGVGDYAEIPPVVNNEITLTGYQWLSLWILPNDRNRLSTPPRDSEELVIDYRKALTNA